MYVVVIAFCEQFTLTELFTDVVIRPPDIVVGGLRFTRILSFFLFLAL